MNDSLHAKALFADKALSAIDHPLKEYAKKLLVVSDFACRHVVLLQNVLQENVTLVVPPREAYFKDIATLPNDMPHHLFMRALRQFRNGHFLRLLLLTLSEQASTEAILRAWSDCADAIILHALAYCYDSLQQPYGTPRNSAGEAVPLYTLAMGKLGGLELNYSSDIDLIFTYSEAGDTDGPEPIPNAVYFSKVVQQFIQLLQQITQDGFVFRVDLRLRPNGNSGPLVLSLSAMETYYQEQGRDWERYAMVKARVITPKVNLAPAWFEQLITPFVYRRYVDFSVIESLRSMKALIEREVALNPRLNDIKRGQGGIREIEFIIQNFQLIRGGRLTQLQQPNALLALSALSQEKLLPHSGALKKAYLFLRALENALQSLNDQQTHALPCCPIQAAQLSLSMGLPDWNSVLHKLHQVQRIVHYAFHSVLGKVESFENADRVLANQLTGLWQGHIEQDMATNLLTSLGYKHAAHCFQMIHTFRHSPRCRRLPQVSRLRLDRFMLLVLTELIQHPQTEAILLQMVHLMENIIGRSAYLALLTENPKALKELIFWFSNSPFISALLVNQPFLLDILLNDDKDWQPPTLHQLKKILKQQLERTKDLEQQEEILREFKLTYWLLAARAEMHGTCDAVRIGQLLADVASAIVIQVFTMAYNQLSTRYPEMERLQAGFAIIAYGKLGSREMNYTSDLDLVFLHAAQDQEAAAITRLTQKILHMLTMRSQTGILYAVDTRLRPSGSAGLLVSTVQAFISYQHHQAWTWEHQALLKARILVGPRTIRHTFTQLKQSILSRPRDLTVLRQEVLSMLAKINQHQDASAIKHVPGGLLDLEFLIQYLLLKLGDKALARYTHPLQQMQQLLVAGLLTEAQHAILKEAYVHYHAVLHSLVLQPTKQQSWDIASRVQAVCQALYD